MSNYLIKNNLLAEMSIRALYDATLVDIMNYLGLNYCIQLQKVDDKSLFVQTFDASVWCELHDIVYANITGNFEVLENSTIFRRTANGNTNTVLQTYFFFKNKEDAFLFQTVLN